MPLGGIISGIGSLASGYYGYKGQKEANKTNIQLAEQARQHDIEMWNRQNAYNTPQMQMQRMKEGGLNPNLIYGSGAGNNTASPPQKSPVPRVENELAALAQSSLVPTISLYQDWQVKKAQIDNIQAEQASKESMTRLNNLKYSKELVGKPYWELNAIHNQWKNQNEADLAHRRLEYQNEKNEYAFKSFPALLNQIQLRNAVLEQSKQALQLENDLSRNLKPYGLTSKDNVWARILLNLGNNPKIKPLFNLLTK